MVLKEAQKSLSMRHGNSPRPQAQSLEILLKADFRSAFNSVRRDILLRKAAKFVPKYFHLISAAYYSSWSLFCGKEIL